MTVHDVKKRRHETTRACQVVSGGQMRRTEAYYVEIVGNLIGIAIWMGLGEKMLQAFTVNEQVAIVTFDVMITFKLNQEFRYSRP